MADFFGNIAGTVGNVAVAIFSTVFITFFFLKDESLFSNAVLSVIPDHLTDEVTRMMSSTKKLLIRYFGGLVIEVSGVILLSFIGFLILGISFNDALLMGFLAGILNIIPYIGPIMGGYIGRADRFCHPSRPSVPHRIAAPYDMGSGDLFRGSDHRQLDFSALHLLQQRKGPSAGDFHRFSDGRKRGGNPGYDCSRSNIYCNKSFC